MPSSSSFRPVDDDARQQARDLIDAADFASLAVIRPETGTPSVTRIALATGPSGEPLSLVSTLSTHTAALQANPVCSLLIGAVKDRGDPLTQPRLTLHAEARLIPREAPAHPVLRAHFLSRRPKAGLYIDFADFHLLGFRVTDGLLNAGFGKAYRLSAEDLDRW